MKNPYFLLVLIGLQACSDSSDYRELSLDTYRDKMKAAWIGQMAGVGWGLPTEFDYIGSIIPVDEVPVWNTDMVNMQGNDDLYVEMTFLASMERHGTDLSFRQAGIDFANTEYSLWAANKQGRENLRNGIPPPSSGHPYYNVHCEDIDYQIEADFSGIIAPGMPRVAIGLGEKFGAMMNYGDGLYAGQFIGGMYTEAFFSSDMQTIIEKGLQCIPAQSNYANCIRDVMAWHHQNPGQWEVCWDSIMNKYYRSLDHQPFHRNNPGAWVGIDAKLNGAFVVLGLLYGGGDMDSTIIYSMRCGLDSDCNPSNAAGILATTIGYEKLPGKFKKGLDVERQFAHTTYNFNDLLVVSEYFARQFTLGEGGKILKDRDGMEQLYIRKHKPQVSEYHPASDPGPLDTSLRYSAREMEQILAYPASGFASLLEDDYPGWTVHHAGKKSRQTLIPYEGKDGVLQLSPMSASRSAVLEYTLETLDVNDAGVGGPAEIAGSAVLSFKVKADPALPWDLGLRIRVPGENLVHNERIGDDEAGGWKTFTFKFPLTAAKVPPIRIEIKAADGNLNRAYITDLSIKEEV